MPQGPWLLTIVVAMLMVALASPVAHAQSLDQVLLQILSSNCPQLSGNRGPHLGALCAANNNTTLTGGGSGTGGGSVSAHSQFLSSDEQRRLYERLRERREAEEGKGFAAPMTLGRGVGLFFSGEYQAFDKDVTRFEPGFHRDTAGGTLGADYSFGGAIAGLAFSYAHEDGRFDNAGGSFENDAYGLTLYGSVAPVRSLFIDGLVAYTRRNLTLERQVDIFIPGILGGPARAARGRVSSFTAADEVKAGVHAGYDFIIGALTVGPRAGVDYRDTTIDPFGEHGTTGVELFYRRQNEKSLTTSAGVFTSYAVSTGVGVLIPQLTGEYIHEFLDDQRSIRFQFREDPLQRRFLFQNDPPDRDYFNLSAGVVMVLPHGVAPFVNYRTVLGYRDQSSHTVTAGVRFEF
jgi:outer membrane lipase/esterase